MVDRGFGLALEGSNYGEVLSKEDFNESDLDWWSEAESVDFKLNDEPVIKSGSSRMNRRARAGVMKPSGSTSAEADLEKFAWYWRAFLDNYQYTAGNDDVNIHEFWGGENKSLQSFRAVAVYDMLKKYLYGLLCDGLKFEVSDDAITIDADWIYRTEQAGIIGEDGETFTRPDALEEEIFLMFFDVGLYLNDPQLQHPMGGVQTSFSYEGSNNHDVDGTIGLGSRYPQSKAQAGKRDNKLTIATSLTKETVRAILDAEYGEVGALTPSSCKLLQVRIDLDVRLCENSDIGMIVTFPSCTLNVEYDMSGADRIEATMNLQTLGTGSVKLEDNSEITTDMYVKLSNYQTELGADASPSA